MSDMLLPLNDVIRALRLELRDAYESSEDQEIRFELGPVEVEFSVVAKREGGPDGKIKFSVLGVGAELGASAKFAGEQTQRIKLSLTPLLMKPGEEPTQVVINRTPPVQPSGRPSADPLQRAP